jgi:hypothetical protein
MGSLGTPFFGPTNGTFAGGGGGNKCTAPGGTGGPGGGGNAVPVAPGVGFAAGTAGATNTGGGAGASYDVGPGGPAGVSGGSGRVIINFPSGATVAVTPCTNSVNPSPGCKQTAVFTVSGTLTVS